MSNPKRPQKSKKSKKSTSPAKAKAPRKATAVVRAKEATKPRKPKKAAVARVVPVREVPASTPIIPFDDPLVGKQFSANVNCRPVMSRKGKTRQKCDRQRLVIVGGATPTKERPKRKQVFAVQAGQRYTIPDREIRRDMRSAEKVRARYADVATASCDTYLQQVIAGERVPPAAYEQCPTLPDALDVGGGDASFDFKTNGRRKPNGHTNAEIHVQPSSRRSGYDVVSVSRGPRNSVVRVIAEGVALSRAESIAQNTKAHLVTQGTKATVLGSSVTQPKNPTISIFHKASGTWLGDTEEYPTVQAAVAGERQKNGMEVVAEIDKSAARKPNHHHGHHEPGDPLGIYLPPLEQWRRGTYDHNALLWEHPSLGWTFQIVPQPKMGRNAFAAFVKKAKQVIGQDFYYLSTKGRDGAYERLRQWYASQTLPKQNGARQATVSGLVAVNVPAEMVVTPSSAWGRFEFNGLPFDGEPYAYLDVFDADGRPVTGGPGIVIEESGGIGLVWINNVPDASIIGRTRGVGRVYENARWRDREGGIIALRGQRKHNGARASRPSLAPGQTYQSNRKDELLGKRVAGDGYAGEVRTRAQGCDGRTPSHVVGGHVIPRSKAASGVRREEQRAAHPPASHVNVMSAEEGLRRMDEIIATQEAAQVPPRAPLQLGPGASASGPSNFDIIERLVEPMGYLEPAHGGFALRLHDASSSGPLFGKRVIYVAPDLPDGTWVADRHGTIVHDYRRDGQRHFIVKFDGSQEGHPFDRLMHASHEGVGLRLAPETAAQAERSVVHALPAPREAPARARPQAIFSRERFGAGGGPEPLRPRPVSRTTNADVLLRALSKPGTLFTLLQGGAETALPGAQVLKVTAAPSMGPGGVVTIDVKEPRGRKPLRLTMRPGRPYWVWLGEVSLQRPQIMPMFDPSLAPVMASSAPAVPVIAGLIEDVAIPPSPADYGLGRTRVDAYSPEGSTERMRASMREIPTPRPAAPPAPLPRSFGAGSPEPLRPRSPPPPPAPRPMSNEELAAEFKRLMGGGKANGARRLRHFR